MEGKLVYVASGRREGAIGQIVQDLGSSFILRFPDLPYAGELTILKNQCQVLEDVQPVRL